MTPDLAHRHQDGKRPAIRVGAMVVLDEGWDPRDEEDLGMGSMSLHRVVGGPWYRRHPVTREVTRESWNLDEMQEAREKSELLVVEVRDMIGNAAICTTQLLSARAYDPQLLALTMLTLERLIELAERRRIARPEAEILSETLDVSAALVALRAAVIARDRFAHVAVPTLLRNLYLVGGLTLAEISEASPRGWTSNVIGWPHDKWTELHQPRRTT